MEFIYSCFDLLISLIDMIMAILGTFTDDIEHLSQAVDELTKEVEKYQP